ncbi:peptidase S14 ClpP [Catenulispora acidiphila DSM 44928]|uniref:ATP-dependent Clp protease proteolytic subunit n=1 Tax=Catenulispora acidiphila (strain DSM 44928 / JCM 14897 / NBRC 102108 / NRRL B-24433 / ID139908) TaxID=479433 RepID=C7Q187_CATAD|nr:head maturation protease, ClpP-related [Catenulispora acidiphila]ACU71762.1 peptidase S14 ClpP [Catenulispora acidiphila DSM 44928]
MGLSRLKTTRTIANLRAGRNDWFRIKAQADGPTQVMIYDEVGFFGVTAQDFIDEMKQVDGPIDLHLNSPGGEVWDGIAIHAYLSGRGGVTTYVDALAASIASVIAMAGEQIVMGRNASLMIHDGWGLVIGNAADMREQAELLDRVSDNIASIYADRTGKPKDDWRAAMLAETWYIGQEAVDAGLADRMADPPAKPSKAAPDDEATKLAAHFDLSVFRNTPDRLKAAVFARVDAAEKLESDAQQTLAQARADADDQLKLLNDSDPEVQNAPVDGLDAARQPDADPPPTTTQLHDEAPVNADRGFSIPAGGPMDSIPAEPFRNWLNQGLALIGDQGSESGSDNISNAAMHEPYDGTHTHAHPAFGAQGDDDSHEHEHTHSGDADHRHDHGDEESDGDGGMTTNSLRGDRILGIESMPLLNKSLPVHHTDTVDTPWDGPAAVAAMPNDDKVLRYCHAWMSDEAAAEKSEEGDDDADDKKDNYRFPHHKTEGGPANLAACRNGLARLPGSKIPDSDKPGVEKHLQAHLDDADKSDSGDHGDSPSNHTHGDLNFAWDPSMTAALKEAMQ